MTWIKKNHLCSYNPLLWFRKTKNAHINCVLVMTMGKKGKVFWTTTEEALL